MSLRAPAKSERVVARTSFPSPCMLRLREPCGHDELALDGIDTRAAVGLLDRLVEPAACVTDLSASDRDALLATLYRGLWGDRIVATRICDACDAPYDLSFTLSGLQRQIEDQREATRVTGPRAVLAADGWQLYLPDAAQEEEAAAQGMAAGASQLARMIAPDAGTVALDARLEAVAPLIDVDLDIACAECGHAATARFDIQSFALQRLLDEREEILAQVHALAGNYGWSLTEILGLARSLRRSFAERVGGGLA